MAGWFKLIKDRLFQSGQNKSDWKYKKETIPELGQVNAVYLDDELQWYDYQKHGAILEINCQVPGGKEAGIKVAKSISPADIQSHQNKAVQSIPAEEMEAWGFIHGSGRSKRSSSIRKHTSCWSWEIPTIRIIAVA